MPKYLIGYSVSVFWLNLWAILVQIIMANRCERKRLYSTNKTRYRILILRKTSEQFINMKDRIWICYCWTCSNVPCSGYTNCLELVELHLQNIFCVMPGGRIVYPKLVKIYLNTTIWLVSFLCNKITNCSKFTTILPPSICWKSFTSIVELTK